MAEEMDALVNETLKVVKQIYKQAVSNKLRELAEDYVTEQYAPVGHLVCTWEDWDDESDDTTATVESSPAPPEDTENYHWFEVVGNSVISSEVTEFDDAAGEYTVIVYALISINSGFGDDEEDEVDEAIEPEDSTIYVYFEKDEEGDFCVVGVEE